MRIHVNGEVKDVPDGLDLGSLLKHLEMPERRIAIELDREVIRRTDWPATVVRDGARIEIVHFVGGG
jgi:thiamine biosynthesis protein ThiS